MNDNNARRPWQLVEIWGDTVDLRHLGGAIVIGIAVSLAGYLLAKHELTKIVSEPALARAYAMLAGLAGCIAAGVICAKLFPPKRRVTEDGEVDPVWRQEVLARLAEESGGLGSVRDLPPVVVREMKELEIYDLFVAYEAAQAARKV